MCIDLRGMWGKLHVLHWAIASVRRFATLHHINADTAFLDGVRCGQRLPQIEFFARPLRPLPEDAAVDEEEEGAGDDEADDGPDTPPKGAGGAQPQGETDDRGDGDDSRLSGAGDDFPRRMGAVEDRAEHASALIALVLARAAAGVAQDLADIWAAFDRFCRTCVGISARTMLGAWAGPLAEDYEQVLKQYPRLKPDAAKADEYFGLICAAWDRRFPAGPQEGVSNGG